MNDKNRKRRWGWKRVVGLTLLALPVIGFAMLWFDEPEPLPNAKSGESMQAVVYDEYGTPDVLRVEAIEKLLPNDNQILVRVRAAAANPLDWHYVRGTPYVMRIDGGMRRPHDPRLGVDLAGVVEAIGAKITKFQPGDEVFGLGNGSFGEYALAYEHRLARKPPGVSFEQAAAIPVAAGTALQSLREKGKVGPGTKVLINGASGGVGTFTVQIAKSLGAEVTGVCSTRNVELVRSLGADHVIDYKAEDFTQRPERYDVIVDNVGIHDLSDLRRPLTPTGILVLVGGGGPDAGDWIGPLARPLQAFVMSPFIDQEVSMLLADIRTADLELLVGMVESGTIKPVIDRTYRLDQVPEAIRYLEGGRARGKVIIAVDES